MSKSKSQIGSSPLSRQQPPPLLPGPRWATTPPIAGVSVVIRRSPAPGADSQDRHTTTRHETRISRDPPRASTAVVASTSAKETAPAQGAGRKSVTVQAQESAPGKTVENKVSPEAFKKLIAQLQVRIDKLSELQKTRGLVLADPAVHQDHSRWQRLLAEFETAQEKLDELVDRREFAEAQLESLRAPVECGSSSKRFAQRQTITVLRARLGQRVRELRTRRGLSQETLARLAEIPAYTLPSIETGDKSTSMEVLASIAHALDLTLSELLLGVDAHTPEAARLGGVLASCSAESQRALDLVEIALGVAAPPRDSR